MRKSTVRKKILLPELFSSCWKKKNTVIIIHRYAGTSYSIMYNCTMYILYRYVSDLITVLHCCQVRAGLFHNFDNTTLRYLREKVPLSRLEFKSRVEKYFLRGKNFRNNRFLRNLTNLLKSEK